MMLHRVLVVAHQVSTVEILSGEQDQRRGEPGTTSQLADQVYEMEGTMVSAGHESIQEVLPIPTGTTRGGRLRQHRPPTRRRRICRCSKTANPRRR